MLFRSQPPEKLPGEHIEDLALSLRAVGLITDYQSPSRTQFTLCPVLSRLGNLHYLNSFKPLILSHVDFLGSVFYSSEKEEQLLIRITYKKKYLYDSDTFTVGSKTGNV